jgi:uncharacterized repeat protein (TIGR04138 family)
MNSGLASFYLEILEKDEADYPFELYSFLYETIVNTAISEKAAAGLEKKVHHLSPEKICALFSQRLRQEFDSFTRLVLDSWHVNSSSDVGRAVFKMAEYGCLKLSGTEEMQDFERAGLDIA